MGRRLPRCRTCDVVVVVTWLLSKRRKFGPDQLVLVL
jgi:hypothetical protein